MKKVLKELNRLTDKIINLLQYLINIIPFLSYEKVKKPVELISINNSLDVEKISINLQNLNLFKIKKGKIYTSYGYVIDSNNRIIKELSHDLNPDRFKVHKLYSKIYAPPTKLIKGNVAVLASDSCDSNYYHWLIETLPKLMLYKNSNIKIDKYFTSIKFPYQQKALKMLGIEKNQIIDSDVYPFIKADNIIAAPFISDYPDWATEKQIKSPKFFSEQPLILLKNELLSKVEYKENDLINFQKIYISREKASWRKFSNEKEVQNLLVQHGFKVIYLEEEDFANQIKIFNQAQIIVSVHGAGLANILFCNKKAKLIEIFGENTLGFYRKLSEILNLQYVSVNFKEDKFGNIIADLHSLENLLQ